MLQVRNYLIYRTAKDASILITLQPRKSDLTIDCDSNETVFPVADMLGFPRYYCNAAIIDLDLKPFSKMKDYMKKEWAIYDAVARAC